MDQNTIAVIWDFDKTLISGYMYKPILKAYGIEEKAFWDEINALPEQYEKRGIHVNKETIYMNHIITCINQGIFKDLNNSKLREFGKELEFYPGIPDFLKDIKSMIASERKYQAFSIHVEHYIVSNGLTEIIKGSKISSYVDGIWGCEFIENPIRSNLNITLDEDKQSNAENVLNQIGCIMDSVSKTRAIFEINKGTNKFSLIDVNCKIDKNQCRVPFENMIYIGHSSSDIPVFSILQKYGGKIFAVYSSADNKSIKLVNNLIKARRINWYAKANYLEGTIANMTLKKEVKEIAERIYDNNLGNYHDSTDLISKHINW